MQCHRPAPPSRGRPAPGCRQPLGNGHEQRGLRSGASVGAAIPVSALRFGVQALRPTWTFQRSSFLD